MNEVVAELDGSDFEDSEDDFDGYLDMKSNDEAYMNKRRDGAVEGDKEITEKEDVLIDLLSSPLAFLPSNALAWRFSSCECHKL